MTINQDSNQRKKDQSTTTTSRGEERGAQKSFEFSSKPNENEIHQRYQLINRYSLKNDQQETVRSWGYAEPNESSWYKKLSNAHSFR